MPITATSPARLVPKDPLLGGDVAGEIAMAIEMIGREVEPDGHAAVQPLARSSW